MVVVFLTYGILFDFTGVTCSTVDLVKYMGFAKAYDIKGKSVLILEK